MIARVGVILALFGTLLGGEQAVALPLPELLRRLDAKQEWLLLPQDDYERLVAAGRDPAPRPEGEQAFLASAVVSAQVVEGEVRLEAAFTALNRGPGAALAELFAAAPERLGAVEINGTPALLAPGQPPRLLLPTPGRFTGTVRWTATLAGDIHRRQAGVPLPLAGGLSFVLRGDGRGQAEADGLVRAGDTWHLAAAPPPLLRLAWLPAAAGDQGPVFAAEHVLAVTEQDGPRPLQWAVRLLARRGMLPATLHVRLPPGFTCTRALSGVARLEPVADGVLLTPGAGAETCAVEGLLAAEAPVALPSIVGAAWQSGTVSLRGTTALACETPPGWRPLGGTDERSFAVNAPDAGMRVTRLAADAGLAISTSATLAVGPQRAVLDQVLLVRAGGTRVFRLPVRLPPGWRPIELSGEGFAAPTVEDLAPGGTVLLALPAGLAPGDELSIVLRAEALTAELPAFQPAVVPDAVRASHHLLLAAAPGIDLGITAPGWRPPAAAEAAPAGTRAELRADGQPAPVELRAAPRPAAVEVEAVCWLLPAADRTWCRYDLRLAVRDGELTALELDLPLQRDADLRLSGEGLTLTGDGPFLLSAPKAWRGERVLRIEGRLRAAEAGRLPRLAAALPGAPRPVVVRRWAALQSPPDLDLRLAPGPGARPIDADELPSWSAAIPGATVLAAWRLGEGDFGGWRGAASALAPVPAGFVDALELASQISPEGWRTRAAFRLSAVGQGELDLGLPDGAGLEQAAVDGAPAAVRRDGGRLLLALPGRTLVQVALRYAGNGSAERLEPPRLGGLPVTRTRWTVAVDPSLRARPLTQPEAMPLVAAGDPIHRSWLGGWRSAPAQRLVVGPLADGAVVAAPADPRALVQPRPPATSRSDPAIVLDGHLYSGERIGVPQAALFALEPLVDLRRGDALGRVLAVLLGLLACLAPCGLRRTLVVASLAAVPCALALIAWQSPAGPLLALCEWLPLAVCAGILARLAWFARRSA